MTWDKAIPAATDSPCNSVTGITNNWTAWTTWIGREHYNMASALSGQHKAGLVSVLTSGTSAQMNALSSTCGTGALWWDTSGGALKVYRDDGWGIITSEKYSRVGLIKTTQSLSTGWNLLTWDSAPVDTLSESVLATNIVTVVGEGYYMVTLQAKFPVTAAIQKGIAIYKDGTKYSQTGNYGGNVVTCELNDIIYCEAGMAFTFYAYAGSALTLTSATATIVRLS